MIGSTSFSGSVELYTHLDKYGTCKIPLVEISMRVRSAALTLNWFSPGTEEAVTITR